jgi:hypothetical protein
MTRKLLLTAILSFSLLFTYCKNTTVAPELTPGIRNYFWELDTLDMPMNYIGSVWGASPNDVWAVGAGGTEYDRLLHYDGSMWSTYTKEPINCAGEALFGFSADNVWMGGQADLVKGAGIWHYDGVKWSQNYVYDITDAYLIAVQDIWGNSPNDLYASGVIDFKEGSTDVWRGFVLRYDGRRWSEVVRAQFNSQFIKVRLERNKVYIFSVGVNYANGALDDFDLEFYQLNGNKLEKIYSGKESQINWANLHAINRKAYFVVDRDVYTYANRMLIKRLSIHYPQFNWAIFGRSEVDLFVGMKDGLAHYDGTDTEYIYNFPGNHMGAVNEPIIFEKEIFLGISSPRNMVLHGRLKE